VPAGYRGFGGVGFFRKSIPPRIKEIVEPREDSSDGP
jgi:hypothetical protein